MSIPFLDLKKQYDIVKDEINQGLNKVFETGNFILGQEEKDFEIEFAKYCDVSCAIGVNSGTDALYLALSALGIGAGDEVILPAFTFIATALCVSYTGARPVFVDIDERTYNINPHAIKDAMTDKTKAIMPVHIYGQPADMQEILDIAEENNLKVVEDTAQAHGATYQGRRVGSFGTVGCFSFYPTKSLGAFGDGGMITTKDQELYKKAFMLRDYGRVDRYRHKVKGFNSRLDTVQAVILSAKLKYLDQWNQMREEIANQYNAYFKDVDGVMTPFKKDDRSHVYQTYAIRIKKDRDRIAGEMQQKGINVLIHYPMTIPEQEAYQELGYKKGDFPVSEKVCKEILSLPMFPHMSDEQVQGVCETLKGLI